MVRSLNSASCWVLCEHPKRAGKQAPNKRIMMVLIFMISRAHEQQRAAGRRALVGARPSAAKSAKAAQFGDDFSKRVRRNCSAAQTRGKGCTIVLLHRLCNKVDPSFLSLIQPAAFGQRHRYAKRHELRTKSEPKVTRSAYNSTPRPGSSRCPGLVILRGAVAKPQRLEEADQV